MGLMVATAGTRTGTLGGTLLSVLPNLHTGDLVNTVVLATVGATVSFVISLLWKWIIKKFRW